MLSKFNKSTIPYILAKSASGAFVLKILCLLISFLTHALLARIIGIEEFGLYTYIATWIALLSLPAMLGMTTGSVRYISKYRAQENWPLLKGFLNFNLIVPALASIVVSAITGLAVYFIADSAQSLNAWLVAACFLLPLNVLLTVQTFSLRGFKMATRAEIPTLIYSLAFLVVLWLVAEFNDEWLDSVSAMLIRSIATALAFVVIMRFIYTAKPAQLNKADASYDTAGWLKECLPLLLITGMSVVLKRTDVIMLGMFSGTTDAGIYSVAVRIADITLLSFTAVVAIAAPMMSEYFSTRQTDKLRHVVKLSARGVFCVTALTAAIIFMFPIQLMNLFGSDFSVGYIALIVLTASQLVNSFAGPVGQLLIMTGKSKVVTMILGGNLVLNIALNLILIPIYGMNGAAMATGISLVSAMMMSVWRVHKEMGIWSTAI